jgi:hypothetical protein
MAYSPHHLWIGLGGSTLPAPMRIRRILHILRTLRQGNLYHRVPRRATPQALHELQTRKGREAAAAISRMTSRHTVRPLDRYA